MIKFSTFFTWYPKLVTNIKQTVIVFKPNILLFQRKFVCCIVFVSNNVLCVNAKASDACTNSGDKSFVCFDEKVC